jgi:PAS domain S-box-containing protein
VDEKSRLQEAERNRLIASINEATPDMLLVVSIPGRETVYMNREPLQMLGFSTEEIKAMTKEARQGYLVHPEDNAGMDGHYESLSDLKDHEVRQIEYRALNKDGNDVWLRMRSVVFERDKSGAPIKVLHILQNISGQKKTEELLQEQLHFIRQVAITLPDMLSVIELSTRNIAYANQEPFLLNGFDLDEIRAMSPPERASLIHPDDAAGLRAYFENFAGYTDTEIQQFEYRGKTKHNGWQWFRVRGKVFKRNADGVPTHCVNIVQNIHKLRQAEEKQHQLYEKIKANEALLREAEKIGRMGSWEKNPNTGELLWSDGLYDIFGIDRTEAAITSEYYIGKYVHPDDREPLLEHIRSMNENQSESSLEYRIITTEGEKILLSQPRIEKDANGAVKALRGIVRDITFQKHAEERVIELKLNQQKEVLFAVLQAQEQERERIGEALHNGVAQLLYGIQTRLQLLKVADGEERKKISDLQTIVKEAIQDTRRISFELVPAVLKDFGVEVALRSLLERIIPPQLSFTLVVEGISARLPEQIESAVYRIVQELVNNVVKHAEATSANATLSLKRNILTILVTDNGKGFEEKSIETAHKGIGLQTVRNRVKLLEGKMVVRSGREGTQVEVKMKINS